MSDTMMLDDNLPSSQPVLVESGLSQRVEDMTVPPPDEERVSVDGVGNSETESDRLAEAARTVWAVVEKMDGEPESITFGAFWDVLQGAVDVWNLSNKYSRYFHADAATLRAVAEGKDKLEAALLGDNSPDGEYPVMSDLLAEFKAAYRVQYLGPREMVKWEGNLLVRGESRQG
ncbi:hypothetical protein ACEPAI_2597 [Sanghuangporus weigelae]